MTTPFSRLPKALLLDIDNTVYPYAPCHAAGLKSAFSQSRDLGFWDDENSFREAYDLARRAVKSRIQNQAAGHSRLLYFKEMVEVLRGYTLFDQTCRIEQAYWDGYATALILDRECERVLRHVLASGIKVVWISNFTTARQIWKLKRLGLGCLESLLVTSEEAGADKPDPAIVDLALARLGLDPHNASGGAVWFIGDESADVDAADYRQVPILFMCRENTQETAPRGLKLPVRNWKQIGDVFSNARN